MKEPMKCENQVREPKDGGNYYDITGFCGGELEEKGVIRKPEKIGTPEMCTTKYLYQCKVCKDIKII